MPPRADNAMTESKLVAVADSASASPTMTPGVLEAEDGDGMACILPTSARVMRGSYMMPLHDFELLAALKARAHATGAEPGNSELLRAGLHALMESGRAELRRTLDRLQPPVSRSRRGRRVKHDDTGVPS